MSDLLTLIKDIKDSRSLAHNTIQIALFSDINLDPWFPLFLEKEFADHGYRALISRYSLSERFLKQDSSFHILWMTKNDAHEIELLHEPGDMIVNSIEQPVDTLVSGLSIETPYPKEYLRKKAQECVCAYRVIHERRKKSLILDCDNVLWKGILSDNDGISPEDNPLYSQMRQTAIWLSEHGVLISICSKNDYEDVKQYLHSDQELLKLEQVIVHYCCGWEPKSVLLQDLFDNSKLDPADCVFIDDDPAEVTEVKLKYPNMFCIEFNHCFQMEQLLDLFPVADQDISPDNKLRILTYQDDVKRRSLEKNSNSHKEYLDKLATQVNISLAIKEELWRISDLSRRANRCTNGIRYTVEDLESKPDHYILYAIYAKDIFRDLGLIGGIGIDSKTNRLDLFCISCRVLGRDIEDQLLDKLCANLQSFSWLDSGKNLWLLQKFQKRFQQHD